MADRRFFPVDKKLKKIFDKVEKQFEDEGVTRGQIVEIYYLLFKNAKQLISSGEYPTIRIPGLGIFRPKIKALKKRVRLTEDEEKKEIYQKVLDRLVFEKNKRKRNK